MAEYPLNSVEDFRGYLKAMNPRPGWVARNMASDHGRIYDFTTSGRKARAYVWWDWTDREIMVYIDNACEWQSDGYGEKLVDEAMAWTEARLIEMKAAEDA